MNFSPIITDEQLRDFRDGILPKSEHRLVAIQLDIDENCSMRYLKICSEIPEINILRPSTSFSSNILRQLSSESLIYEPVRIRQSNSVIKGVMAIFFLLICLLVYIILQIYPNSSSIMSKICLNVNWTSVIASRPFQWTIGIGCLLPAILLIYRQIIRIYSHNLSNIKLS